MKSIVYDQQIALNRARGDQTVARRFVAMLLESLPEAECSVSEALARDDLYKLKESAHRLAGAAGYCGAVALQEVATRLERQSREGTPESNAALTRELLDEIERFRRLTAAQVPNIHE